jgi:hypothetical protein
MRWMMVAAALVVSTGCSIGDEMGALEALDTLSAVNRSSSGDQATQDVVEISTDFTIGAALEDAAASVGEFWDSQVPCTTVTVEGATATVDYGTLADNCVYQGQTYAGVNTITVSATTVPELIVDHTWTGFTNGSVTVDGAATATWDGSDDSRTVVTEHTFTLADDPDSPVDVVGEHVTRPLEADVPWWQSGFVLDGERAWTQDGEDWSLTMEGLELRLLDPCPQAGVIETTAPTGRSLVITYERVDDDTISATLSGMRGEDRVYHVSRLGAVEEAPAE